MISKDMAKLLSRLRKRGYRTVPTSGAHYKIYSGNTLVATAGGGQNWRSIHNLECEIRKFERRQREKINVA